MRNAHSITRSKQQTYEEHAGPSREAEPPHPTCHISKQRRARQAQDSFALLVLDCRVFQDPGEGSHRDHLGFHPGIMEHLQGSKAWIPSGEDRFVNGRRVRGRGRSVDFWEWLDESFCKPFAEILQEGQATNIEVLHVCKSGRHRSVAIAQMLAMAMPAGYEVQMQHYSAPMWEWWQARCGRHACQECFGLEAESKHEEIAEVMMRRLDQMVFKQLRTRSD
jgi:hypothetical protein